jgi:hypothetical protein
LTEEEGVILGETLQEAAAMTAKSGGEFPCNLR